MKKLITLLTLMLCVCSGAWADNNTSLISGITLPGLPTGTYQGGTNVTHKSKNIAVVADANGNSVMQACAPGYGSPTGDFSWANATDGTDGNWSTTGTTWSAPEGSLFVGSANYNNSNSSHNVAFERKCNLRNVRTFAYRFTNCGGISALVKSQGTKDDAAACMAVYEVGTNNTLTPVGTASSKINAVDIITVEELSASKTYVAYIYGMNGSNGELYEVAFLAPSTNSPKLSSSPKSITLTATESGVAVSSSFTITGSNLTAGTYNLTVPSVTGLTVSPTSFTVASDGTVNQAVQVSYSSTKNVAASTANITATVDEVNLSVAVNYSASVIAWTLQSISAETIWDFSELSGGVEYKDDDLNVEHVYANIPEITFGDGFDATALAFTGRYPLREGKKFCQDGTLRFNTTVPGTIVVKFSDTGTSASATAVKRYLVVNGNTTEYWTSRPNNGSEPYDAQLNITTDAIAVPAGDVTIKGTSAIVVSYLKFTPAAATTITLNSNGYATFSAHYDVAVSGAKAYTAALDFDAEKITCTEIDNAQVPAGNGVLLYGDAGATVTLTPTTGAAALTGNDLKATTLANGTIAPMLSDNNYYALSGDTFKKFEGNAFVANKAYFESTAGLSRSFKIDFNHTTGINSIEATTAADGIYDLQGRRVVMPSKGLYILNGKKVIFK